MSKLLSLLPFVFILSCDDKQSSTDEEAEGEVTEASLLVDLSAEWYYSYGYDSAPSLDCIAFYSSPEETNIEPCPDCDIYGLIQYGYEEGVCNDGSAQVTVPQDVGFGFDTENKLVYEYNVSNEAWNNFGNFPNLMSCGFDLAEDSGSTSSESEVSCQILTESNTGFTFEFEWIFNW